MDKLAAFRKCLWCALAALPVGAQEFSIAGIPVQVHAFVSQGFALSNQNNYLTMDTSQGTFDFRDAGFNVSLQITDKFRVGAQVYDRQIGRLGEGNPTLDWALADYRFTDWFGVRAGKVKTVSGLYNNTQDFESLHTWAILPQSVYPLDLRALSIGHLGGDVYGRIPLWKLGVFAYTAYGGRIGDNRSGGIAYGLEAIDLDPSSIGGTTVGGDLRWNAPLPGILAGVSFERLNYYIPGVNQRFGDYPFHDNSLTHSADLYAQYNFNKWKLDTEYSRIVSAANAVGLFGPYGPANYPAELDQRGYYASAAYRISKNIEIGTYHSWFYPNDGKPSPVFGPLSPPARHIFDQVATLRFDFRNHWDLKVEGHFLNGYGDPVSVHGFYPQQNPLGEKPNTDLLVLRLGFYL